MVEAVLPPQHSRDITAVYSAVLREVKLTYEHQDRIRGRPVVAERLMGQTEI